MGKGEYSNWINVGQAIQSAMPGNDGLGVWQEVSIKAGNYCGDEELEYKWRTFTAVKGVGIGTIYHLAGEHGFIKTKADKPPGPPLEVYEEDAIAQNSEVNDDCFGGFDSTAIDSTEKFQNKSSTELHKPDKEITKNSIISRYIFISTRNRILDTVTGKEMTKDGFDGLFLHIHNNPKAANWLLRQKKCIKVSDVIYLCGENKNPVSYNNSMYWNIWSDPKVELPDQSTDEDIELWLDHLNYLYPNDQEQNHILNWMAWTLQKPHVKINHALLLAGNSRIGKDMLLNPLRYGLGQRNVCEPPATELAETFTDYLHHAKLVVFQEIMNFEGLNLENKLKPMLASPPEMLRVRMFGRGFYETPNIVQAIFMSNYKDALHISEGDGRYFTVWADVKPCSALYYSDLWDWLEDIGNGLVVRWLLRRNLSDFNPKQPAPLTKFKSELIKTSRSPLKHQLQDMVEAMDYPFNVDCVRSLDVVKAMRDKYSIKAVGSVLSEIGCINKECKRATGKREKTSLYAVRNKDDWLVKTPGQWLEEYDSRKDRTGEKKGGV